MYNEQNICPNCGASLSRQGFGFVCDYCGSSFLSEDYTVIDNISGDHSIISERHEYLSKNENYIKSSKFVKVERSSNIYRVLSSPAYYANDGRFNLYLKSNLYFEYLNNCVEETMYMVVCTTDYIDNPYISILLDEEYIITPEFDRWVGNLATFRIGTDEFEEVCESSNASISSNLMECETVHFGEFIPYCRRLYNILFDKCKYIYSIHQIFISDKNG